MKKGISTVIILIILAGITWVIQDFLQNRGLIEYQDKEMGFSFKYPRTWKEPAMGSNYEYYEGAQVVFIKPISQASNFGIKVIENPGFNKFNVEDTIQELDENLAKQFEDFNKVSSREIKILGVPALDYVFRYAVPADFIGTRQVGIQKEIIFLKDEKLYFLMFYAVPGDYERDHKDFEKVVRSFEISKKALNH